MLINLKPMDKFKEILHKMEVVIENDEGISMSVFKALKYGLKVAIRERDELKECDVDPQANDNIPIVIG